MDEDGKTLNNQQQMLSIGEVSEYLGVSIDTLRRWEKKGKVIAYRSPGGHRYFKQKDLDNLFGRKYERQKETKPREIATTEEVKKEEVIKEEPFITQVVPDRPPRQVDIPSTSPIKVIKEAPSPYQTKSEYIPTEPEPVEQSVLTPPVIKAPDQVQPISSIPPASQPQKNLGKKKSNAWIFAVFGLALLIIGFAMFIIFRAPAEVIAPIP